MPDPSIASDATSAAARAAAVPASRGFSPGRLTIALAQYLFCFALLPNLPFWLLARREGIASNGLVNLDGLWLGVAALFVRPRWVFALFTLDFLLDIADAIRVSYSTGFTDVFLSVRYLFTAVATRQMAFVATIVVIVLGLIAMCWVRLRPRVTGAERTALAVGALAILLPWTVATRATLASAFVDHSGRSPSLDLAQAWTREGIWASMTGRGAESMAPASSATDQARPLLNGPTRATNLVLVLVESWGYAHAAQLNAALTAPFTSPELTRRYSLRQGLVGFTGATQEAELRELCNQKPAVPGSRPTIANVDLPGCLPFQLQRAGFRTVALDSALAFWIGGRNWYGTIGFEKIYGFEYFHGLGLPTFVAGPFRSIRDPDAISQIPVLLAADTSKPTFLFFLTVSAHLPINLPLPGAYDADCSFAAATRDSPQACGWYRIERQTLAAVAQVAAAPNLPPSIFVVVGDHAPPFLDSARDAFSATQVPYLILSPR
ncbi:MAG: sulfatase-like hydrolase/transferase [Terriglobales bacterium]